MELGLFVIAFIALMIGGHYLGKKQKRELQEALSKAADGFMLESQIDPETSELSGSVDGIELAYRLVTRGTGKNSESWTECDVTVDTTQLDIALRPQTRSEERWVKKGLARDLLVGDEAFDEKFIVEAAPAELAKRVLSEDLQTEFLEHHPLEVKISEQGLLVEKRGHIEEPDEIRRFTRMAATLANQMNEAVETKREDRQREAATKGYRGASPAEVKRRELKTLEETAELKALRAQRKKAENVRSALIVVALLAGLFALSFSQRYC